MKTTLNRRSRGIAAAAIALISICSAASNAQTIWYVDDDATGEADGSSWFHAFTDMQDALAIASDGDQVWVAAGVYVPGPPDDATTSFVLRNGVSWFGGFAGTETSIDQRDVTTNETILSADVGRDDFNAGGASWYLSWNINTANCGHVIVASDTDRDSVIDGFTISDGHTGPVGTPAGHELMYGSGIYNVGGSPTVRNCTFQYNLAAFASGGAMYNYDGSPLVEDCTFRYNYVHLGHGAGIASFGDSAPEVRRCSFIGGHGVSASTEASGGGITHWADAPIVIEDCLFDGNQMVGFYAGGNTGATYGGGVHHFSGGLTIDRCTFRNNKAMLGGGVFDWGDGSTITNSLFTNNTVFEDPIVSGGVGGAIGTSSFASTDTFVTNCTIINNHGSENGGVYTAWNHNTVIDNSILWGNTATSPEVSVRQAQFKGSTDMTYTCSQEVFIADPGEDPIDPSDYPGCIQDDPMLVDVAGGDFSLSAASPCIDAGDNTVVPGSIVIDLAGNDRFVDDPDSGDTGHGTAPIVDMGAYEFAVAGEPCIADWNGDTFVNTNDFVAYLNDYVAASNGNPTTFGDPDLAEPFGTINTSDFLAFLNLFAAGCA